MSEPTGLDYHAAYAAMFPGLKEQGVRIQDLQDGHLKTVDRAARLRRSERERVKTAVEKILDDLDGTAIFPVADHYVKSIKKKIAEEIR